MGLATLLTVVLVIQFFLSFFTLIRLDRGLCGHDVRLFFLSIFALYSLFFPLSSIAFDFSIKDTQPFEEMLICYNLAMVSFNWVLLKKRRPFIGNVITLPKQGNRELVVILFACLVGFSIVFMVSRGVPVFKFGNEMMDRKEYSSNVDQVWVILSFINTGVACYLIYSYESLTKKYRVILLALLSLYIIFHISLGNRNEYSAIVLFSLGYYLIKRGKLLNLKLILILFLLFVFSFYITIFRDPNTRELARSEAVEIALQSNEFVYPMQTTYYTIQDNWNLRYGYTYAILPIEVMIPRTLYPDKPATLGTEFVIKTFGPDGMGYAYTPVTEAYLNFGLLGPFVVFLLFSLFLDGVVRNANNAGISYKYLMVYALAFNINRGEFASIMYMSLFLYLAYKLCIRFTVNMSTNRH